MLKAFLGWFVVKQTLNRALVIVLVLLAILAGASAPRRLQRVEGSEGTGMVIDAKCFSCVVREGKGVACAVRELGDFAVDEEDRLAITECLGFPWNWTFLP